MKTLALALVLAGLAGIASGEERTVIVPKGEKPFSVAPDDVVRLISNGIAGSRFEIKIDGPAKVETTSNIRQLNNGQALIGATVKEFDLKPTGAGKVTATISVSPPQPGEKAKVTTYVFDVQ